VCAILAYFCPNFRCHGNSLGSLEILDSVFEFADLENPTIHAFKDSVDILYTNEVIPISMFDIFTIAGIGNFIDFCEK